MAARTSPLLARALHFIHPLFSIPSGQTLSVFLTSPPSPPYCISHSSFHLSVTLSYSPEMTSGMRDLAVKCQIFIDVFFKLQAHIFLKGSGSKEKFFVTCSSLVSLLSLCSATVFHKGTKQKEFEGHLQIESVWLQS